MARRITQAEFERRAGPIPQTFVAGKPKAPTATVTAFDRLTADEKRSVTAYCKRHYGGDKKRTEELAKALIENRTK